MPKPTIKSLQARIKDQSDLITEQRSTLQSQRNEIGFLQQETRRLQELIDTHKREVQWHKQLSQNLSEAICAHMRNR